MISSFVQLPGSIALWNESRNAGFHHWIQPLPGLHAIDFVERPAQAKKNATPVLVDPNNRNGG
jgi:hypothetical protein